MNITKKRLKDIPQKTGVYLFRDSQRKVLYVGKAVDLQSRVNQHLFAKDDYYKELMIRERSSDIEYILTSGEAEALILENNLIKQYKPPYNVRLKDDKSYPYIRITVKDKFSRVELTRKVNKKDGADYYGPYYDSGSAKRSVKLVKRLFRIRRCTGAVEGKVSGRRKKGNNGCLNRQMELCSSPCSGGISEKDYRANVKRVKWFLKGKTKKIVKKLKKEMDKAASEMKFERAGELRDLIADIGRISETQRVANKRLGDMDIMGCSVIGNEGCIQVLQVRRGNLVKGKRFLFPDIHGMDQSELITSFLEQLFIGKIDIPQRVLVSHPLTENRFINKWLKESGAVCRITQPNKKEERELVNLAERNAREKLDKLIENKGYSQGLVELKETLGLSEVPLRIEGMDISNISGSLAVGSLVCFEDGKPEKSRYRRYRIKTVQGIDDYAMIREVVRRRYSGLLVSQQGNGKKMEDNEGNGEGLDAPGLLLIDGGKGHLSSALSELQCMELDSIIPLISIAKRDEEIFVPGNSTPMKWKKGSEGLELLKKIRDEAHRFAIAYHRLVRKKRTRESILDDIPGIGKKRKRNLLRKFGSIDKIRRASLEELCKVKLIDRKTSESIIKFFKIKDIVKDLEND